MRFGSLGLGFQTPTSGGGGGSASMPSSLQIDIDATLSVSGQNLTDQTGNSHDFYLGGTSGSESSDPVPTGSGSSAYLAYNSTGDGCIIQASLGSEPDFIKNTHKNSDGVTYYGIAGQTQSNVDQAGNYILFGNENNITNQGFKVSYEHQTGGNDVGIMTFWLADGASGIQYDFPCLLAPSTDYLFIFEVTRASGTTTITMNVNHDYAHSASNSVTSTTDPTGQLVIGNDDSFTNSLFNSGRVYWFGVGNAALSDQDKADIVSVLETRHARTYPWDESPEDDAGNFDIDGFTKTADELNISSIENNARGLTFVAAQTSVDTAIVNGTTNDQFINIDFSTAGDLSSGSQGEVAEGRGNSAWWGGKLSSDGRFLVMSDDTGNEVICYYLTVKGEVESLIEWNALDVSSQTLNPRDCQYSDDGTKLWVIDAASDRILQYTLTIPYLALDSNASYDGALDVSTQADNPSGFYMSRDGTVCVVTDLTDDEIYQYSGTANNITTFTYDSVSVDTSGFDGNPVGPYVTNDGNTLYLAGYANDKIYELT